MKRSWPDCLAFGMLAGRYASSRCVSDTWAAEWSERVSKWIWEWYVWFV